MKIIKAIFFKIRDCIEILIPIMTFSVLFLTFVYSVVARYIFKSPPTWGTEIQVASYIWTVLLSSCYMRRLDKHVRFSMIYDMLSDKGKRYMRIFGNLLLGITYAILLNPTIHYIMKYRTVSPAMRIPVKIYFSPIIVLVFCMVCYSFADVYKDVKALMKGEK
jgi:TRAP-type C4-dicarboxylate transport system permease small subunit